MRSDAPCVETCLGVGTGWLCRSPLPSAPVALTQARVTGAVAGVSTAGRCPYKQCTFFGRVLGRSELSLLPPLRSIIPPLPFSPPHHLLPRGPRHRPRLAPTPVTHQWCGIRRVSCFEPFKIVWPTYSIGEMRVQNQLLTKSRPNMVSLQYEFWFLTFLTKPNKSTINFSFQPTMWRTTFHTPALPSFSNYYSYLHAVFTIIYMFDNNFFQASLSNVL